MKKLIFLLLCAVYFVSCVEDTSTGKETTKEETTKESKADTKKTTPKLTITDMQSALVSLPDPGEAVIALSKMGKVNWSQYTKYPKKSNYKDSYSQSLNLGVRLANVFIAQQAKDKANMSAMTTAIKDLGQQLGIAKDLSKEQQKVEQLIQAGNWEVLFGAAQNMAGQLSNEAAEKGKQELADLVKIGGGIEGLRIISTHLANNYDEKQTEILAQATLVDHYLKTLQQLPAAAKRNEAVQELIQTLPEIKLLLGDKPKATIPVANLQEIKSLTQKSIDAIIQAP